MRVLVTDSDGQFLEIELDYLRKCGHEVVTATDGQHCSEMLREFTPDVFVVDGDLNWAMGAAVEMQTNRTQMPIQAILISDNCPWESSPIPLNFPLAGWFRKPFSMRDLQQKIASLCPKDESTHVLS